MLLKSFNNNFYTNINIYKNVAKDFYQHFFILLITTFIKKVSKYIYLVAFNKCY